MNQTAKSPRSADADRPQRFDGIVGNQTVVKRVAAMLSKNRLPNVIFFTGPTGSGKTTAARIVARAKLCKGRSEGQYEPCDNCSTCRKAFNDTTCCIVEFHEYDANAITDEILDDFKLSFLHPDEVFFIDELQDLAPHLLKRLRKMIEGATATIILTTSHPDEIEDAFRNRLKSYEYSMTRPTVEEAARFLEAQFMRHQITIESRKQLERVVEALNCEMRPIGEFPRKVIAEADGKLTDEYLDELYGSLAASRTNTGGRRKQLI